MPSSDSVLPLESFQTFGDLLKYLRRRARLTQRELCIAVGYSEAQISRLEQNLRPPDLASLTALFIPALYLEDEPLIVTRLMELAAKARGEALPQSGMISFSRSIREEIQESVRTVEEELSNNLPLQLTSFIGREGEILEIKNLLGPENKNRLITLMGSGGCGKTRLAIQIGMQITDAYPNGVWLIELAPISNPAHVAQTFITSLGLPEPRDDSPTLALTKFMRTKHILLIVDNCEHVISETANLIREILLACPHVQVIATSREILNIPGEVRFRVPSLSLSDNEDSQSESVQLFMDRAKTALPTFELTKGNASIVAQICSRLDGIPLAIELAAARMTALSVQQIAARLENSFQLLTGGGMTLLHHQTLDAAIEWSYDLLSESERILLHRLSVFSGGWTLEAAESVASDPSFISKDHVINLLSQLVNKSLVVVDFHTHGEARYIMLQTIHQFAREKLRAAGETESMRLRHFDYFFALAEQGEPNLFVQESLLDWAEAEIDNLRAALTWSLETNDGVIPSDERAGRGLELVIYVWLLWWSRGYLIEGTEWLNRFLNAYTAVTPVRARGLLVASDLAGFRGDYAGKVAFVQESLVISKKLGDRKRIADSLMQMGLVERDIRHYPQAVEFLMEALAGFEELNDNLWICRASFLLAETHLLNGNMQDIKPYLGHGMELCRAANDRWQIAWGLEIMGNVERLEGRLEEAAKFYTESLNLRVEVMDKTGIAFALEAFAQLAAARNEFKQAAVLWGAAEELRKTLNLLFDPLREELRNIPIAKAFAQLGEKIFEEAKSEGQGMKMQQAIEYALTLSRP